MFYLLPIYLLTICVEETIYNLKYIIDTSYIDSYSDAPAAPCKKNNIAKIIGCFWLEWIKPEFWILFILIL